MHLLIPYIRLDPPDPYFDEFTYGDVGQRARKLKTDLNKGDYIFFHTSRHGKKYITACYIVDRVLNTSDVCQDKVLRVKYKNPHIAEWLARKRSENSDDDAIVFGDSIASYVFEKPLLFDKKLAEKLSLNIKFRSGRSETQAIVSSTRAWRELSNKDVDLLLNAITAEKESIQQFTLLSSEEVAETLERDVEQYLARNPALLGKGLTLASQQQSIGEGRLDLLLKNSQGNLVVVEVKYGRIGRDAIHQIRSYIHDLKKEIGKNISGVIVCAGIMPAYEEELKAQKDIQIFVYGWDMRVQKWKAT
jgi:hypothetical protein